MKVVEKAITELTAYENNPRNNDEAVRFVAESIKQFGFKIPIVIDKNNVIVCGHTRVKAAIELNMDTLPCIIVDDLTPEQVRAFRLADNKVSEISKWNFDKLDEELRSFDMTDFDMSTFGFEDIADGSESFERNEVDIKNNSYTITIECVSESDMQDKYDFLCRSGIECRLSTL